ncbi:hypothetical protein J0H58_00685 [bacterium]|nr:hypothetical protein [bacterium]
MTRVVLLFCAGLCAVAVRAQVSDPVKASLDKAVTTYTTEIKEFRAKVGMWLDDREKVARQAGDKKMVDQIKLEREALSRSDALPMTAPPELKQQSNEPQAKLERAYAEGVKDYIRRNKDKEATVLEQELKLVKLGIDPVDKRRRWVHSRGEFKIVKRGEWEELTPDKAILRWQEVGRTKQFIELLIILDKKHYVRLYDTGDGRRAEDEKELKPLFRGGKWVK